MATLCNELNDLTKPQTTGKFSVSLAADEAQRMQCYKLRYDVFANELGAEVRGSIPGVDKDRFDDHCQHLMVRDNNSGQLIATTRLLDREGCQQTGMYYSETEFDLGGLINGDDHFVEVGRTCIHPDYRRGAALPMLWQGIARFVVAHKVDHLIGCASISLSYGSAYVNAAMRYVREHHFSAPNKRAYPRIPLQLAENEPLPDDIILPTLLKGYLRQGAIICGEPYWDEDFNVADVFVMLHCEGIASRYVRHFIDRM
jgi:putative hemolysin